MPSRGFTSVGSRAGERTRRSVLDVESWRTVELPGERRLLAVTLEFRGEIQAGN